MALVGSEGCSSCRKRRKRVCPQVIRGCPPDLQSFCQCDLTQPECERCMRTGLTCGGYGADLQYRLGHQIQLLDDTTQDKKRQRHAKVRSGCSTCKKRRIKCDEAKPICRHCLKSNLVCEGYRIPKPLIFDHHASFEERRRLHFFRAQTIPSIEVTVDADREFWTKAVVQASNAGSCIKTPLLAVSAYHESLTDQKNCSFHQAFAQRKYVDTIQHVTRLQRGSEEISTSELVALSFILRTLETFRNDDTAAAIHLQASRSILEQAGTEDLESSWVRPVLLPMLYRLEYRSLSSSVLNNGDIAAEDGGVERAREKGHAIMSWFCHNLARGRSSAKLKPFRSQAYQTLRKFYSEVDEVSRNREKNGLPMKDILYVKVQWLLVKLTLSTLVFKDEKWNDRATDDFRTLLDLCEECAHAIGQTNDHSQDDTLTTSPIQLSLGMELVATVFLAATWCRDPRVRSKALHFLRSSPRREPRWYSWHAAAIVEWVISKEECGQVIRCASDVPTTKV